MITSDNNVTTVEIKAIGYLYQLKSTYKETGAVTKVILNGEDIKAMNQFMLEREKELYGDDS